MKPGYFNFNGKIIKAGEAVISADNRGFRYGDGLFETLRVTAGKIALYDYHIDRLMSGLFALRFQIPAFLNKHFLAQEILELCNKNNFHYARVRLVLFRGDGGLYDFNIGSTNYIIQAWEIPAENRQLNENGLDVGVYREAYKMMDKFANLKSNNYLPYIMAALFAKENKWNDCLVLNSSGRICDATIANVFLIKDGEIFTPSLSEGCVAGVMRRYLIEKLPTIGYSVTETTISTDQLMEADELWLTNALYGLRWVKSLGDKVYANNHATTIFSKLNISV